MFYLFATPASKLLPMYYLFIMVKIRELVQQALICNYLSIEAENQLRLLLKSKYEEKDLNAFMELQSAVMNGRVRQESRELIEIVNSR